MRSKIHWIAMVLLLVAGIVAACGGNGSSGGNGSGGSSGGDQKGGGEASGSKPVSLTLTMWGSEQDKNTMEERLAIVKNLYPHITVEVNLVAGDYDQKVQTMIAGGTPPDIMMLAENYQVYASKGQIIPLDDYIASHQVDMDERYTPDIANLMKYDGKQYGMPDRAGAMVVYYNKDMFDAANVPYPKKGWTREDFLEAAQKLTIKENGKIVQWGYYPSSWWPQWMQLIYQNGGSLFDESGKPTFDTPEVREALQFFNDLTYKYGVSPTPTEVADLGNIGPDPMFAQGLIAMETTGFWNIGSLAKVEGINWDIAPVWGPTNAFFNGLAITKDSKHKEEAFQVIEALTRLEAQIPIIKNGQDAPATKPALNSDAFLNAEYGGRKINMAAFSESEIYDIPLNPKWNEMQKVIGDKLSTFFNNDATLDETVTAIQKGLEELYQ
ncbi:MAG: ABC transporter substrate-binding protein [Thermobacillus sp. ZCTH02-B1]|uniref:ABC transporter substrate-binding protein n=1 Tax=Thermobacillus sp. ZCTH02-B1 TaxID=1858795 RepID=UPI000B563915|nr:sugar ABC transporter substrate-binding protein [Thermobacillus sp. ZCTH02-B1]OUM97540.1 MAG: ABC transporter substrate-binding protein [Thermobacillus sp. ZCTH02-B1]